MPDPKEGIFELNFQPLVNGQSFEKELVYQNNNGRSYFLEKFSMYISDITLVKEDGEEVLLSEIELLDFANPEANKAQHGDGVFRAYEAPAGAYKGVKFGIGVPQRLNHVDPASFDQDHPLSTFKGMHWNWTPGYKFLLIEGRIDSSLQKDGLNIDYPLAYHTGLDTLYRRVEFLEPEHAFDISETDELQFIVQLDVNTMFQSKAEALDMVQQNFSHTVPAGSAEYEIARIITDNLVKYALFKVPF
ncbi:MAG: hypothetical protein D6730_14515 [Bacteroidetes bacterium]|nr:MAG: hypothetical protein D6730_14515 [Bacteroidota bacterium]